MYITCALDHKKKCLGNSSQGFLVFLTLLAKYFESTTTNPKVLYMAGFVLIQTKSYLI